MVLVILCVNYIFWVDEGFNFDGFINICDWCLGSGGDFLFFVVYFDFDFCFC